MGEGEKTGWTTCLGVFATCFVPVAPNTTCAQAPAKGNGRSGKRPESIRAVLCSVSGAAFSWVLPEPPAREDGQSWSRAPSLCQMVLQMWFFPDGASTLLMSLGSSLPWLNAPQYAATLLCVARLRRALGPRSAQFACASQMPSLCCFRHPIPDPPPPVFYPLHPSNAGTRLAAVFHPPAMLAGWVASARPWVGGRSGAGRGGSRKSGRGIKPGLFLYCKVITRAFQSLICREHPGAIGSLPEPGNNSPITRLLRQSPVNSHTWAHAGIYVLRSCQHVCPLPPSSPRPRNRDGDPIWDPGLWLGGGILPPTPAGRVAALATLLSCCGHLCRCTLSGPGG